MRLHNALGKTEALTQDDCESEGCCTCIDVYGGSTCVVDDLSGAEPRAKLHDPAATPDP